MSWYQGQELASSLKHNYVPNEELPALYTRATVVVDDADTLCMPEPAIIRYILFALKRFGSQNKTKLNFLANVKLSY
jgi:hypothetical protein